MKTAPRSSQVRWTLLSGAVAAAHAAFYWPTWADDAYISFRYARNLWGGEGLVFNPGERVEGITNLAWAVLLAPFAAGDALCAAKVLGVACLVGTVGLVVAWARREGLGALGTFAALAPLVLVPFAPYWAVQGMETPAVMLLLTLGWSRYRLEAEAGGWPLAALGLALAPAFRPDAALAVLLVGLWHLVRPGRRFSRHALVSGGIVLAGAAALVGVKLLWFGEVVPLTWQAKGGTWPFLRGQQVLLNLGQVPWPPFGVLGALAVAWGLLGLARRRDRALPALVVAAGAGSVLVTDKEYFNSYRLLVPVLPALGASLGLLVSALPRAAGALLALVLLGPLPWVGQVARLHDPAAYPRSSASFDWKHEASWVRFGNYDLATQIEQRVFPTAWAVTHARADESLAFIDVGLFGFAMDNVLVDPRGLTDPVMARARRLPAGRVEAARYFRERVDFHLFGHESGNLRWWSASLEDDGWTLVTSCRGQRVYANPRVTRDLAVLAEGVEARVDAAFRRAPHHLALQVAIVRELVALDAPADLVERTLARIAAPEHMRFALADLRCQAGLDPGCRPRPELCGGFGPVERGDAAPLPAGRL